MSFDLGIDIDSIIPASGFSLEVARPATEADLASARGIVPEGTYEVTRISERHHALARAIASGMKDLEAAAVVGYSLNMVRLLSNSPAFVELVEFYRERVDVEFAEFSSRLAGLGKDVLLQIQERMEQAPESFSNSVLNEMLKTIADRTGYAPVNKSIALNVSASLGDKLAEARKRLQEAKL